MLDMSSTLQQFIIECPSFGGDGQIPKKHTGFGEDVSPEFVILGLSDKAKSLSIIMDDLDIPLLGCYNHWLMWNIPPAERIAENACPSGAVQGMAYGKNKYRGPKQPPFIKKAHRYRFTVYALDTMLELPDTSKKADLAKAMEGHVLQSAEVIGWYKPNYTSQNRRHGQRDNPQQSPK